MHLLLFLATVAGALSTRSTAEGVYRQPKTKSALTINIEIGGAPANTTTLDGLISVIPIRGGAVKGKFFNGNLVANLSSSTERVLPGSGGTKTVSMLRFWQLRCRALMLMLGGRDSVGSRGQERPTHPGQHAWHDDVRQRSVAWIRGRVRFHLPFFGTDRDMLTA